MEHYNPIFSKVPTLRFKKYDTNWNRKRLSDYVKKITQKNSNNIIKNVICNSAQNGLIPQLDFFDKEIANDENTVGYYIINNGDFVYNPRKSLNAPYGPVNMYKYEKAGIVSPLYLCFSVDESINKSFLLQRFKSPCWYRYIYLNGDSGARHDRVSIKDDVFLSQPISLPSAEEQTDIAVFLEKIDERIEIQNKIIEDLKILKKELCNKVFSKGTAVRLGELIEEVTVRNKSNACDNVLSVSNKMGFIKQSEQFEDRTIASENKSNYKVVTKGCFAYNPARINVGSIALLSSHSVGIISPMYVCFKAKNVLDSTYLSFYYQSNFFARELQKKLEGSVRQCLTYENMRETIIPYVDIERQREIATTLNRITMLIATEEKCLKALQKQKSYFLNAMFI